MNKPPFQEGEDMHARGDYCPPRSTTEWADNLRRMGWWAAHRAANAAGMTGLAIEAPKEG